MAEYTIVDPTQMAAAMARFGLPAPTQAKPEPRGAVNTGYHVWAGGHRFFLRVNEGKTEADVRFEAEVQRYLHAARFPVPELRLAQDGRPWVEVAGKPAMLFAYAPGEELGAAEIAPDHCRRVGEQLARLHELAAGFAQHRQNPFGRGWVDERLRELQRSPPTDTEAAAVLPMLLDEAAFAHELPGAPRGLVHGDLFPDNVLWIGDRVSALLDWEMCGVDPFAYDLGVAVNAWCFSGTFQQDRARALLAGYAARRKIEPETLAALYEWTRFAALRFTVARLRGYPPPGAHGAVPPGKDWREFRDRVAALRGLAEPSFRALVGM
jgi:homoserine kinase type II